jgi:hypothetical protein
MSLLGSFHNWAGRQSFWMIYWGKRPELKGWEKNFGWNTAQGNASFIRPENGPQSRKLWNLIVEIVSENPESYRALEPWMERAQQRPDGTYRDDYEEYFGRFDGDPEALADNFFIQPNGFYTDYVPEELRKRLGLAGMNQFLGSVAIETVSAQPGLASLLAMFSLSNLLSMFGIDAEGEISVQISGKQISLFPVFTYWNKTHYSQIPYNIGGCAEAHLPTEMQREIITDHKVSFPISNALFPLGNFLRNFVRNAGGPVALLVCWFIPFAPQRKFLLRLAAVTVPYLVLACALGYAPYSRYEPAVHPLILMLAFGGLLGIAKKWNDLKHARF